MGVTRRDVERFLAKINTNGPLPLDESLGACWLWTGSTTRGYGQFVLPRDLYGKQPHVYAHRFGYELTYGPIGSTDLKACHRCDNRLCVRPSHIFIAPQRDNLTDARVKGRLIDGLHARKLSDAAYAEILDSPDTNGALAQRFGVCETSISRIRNGHQGSTYRQLQPTAPHPQQSDRDDHIAPSQFDHVAFVHAQQCAGLSGTGQTKKVVGGAR